MDRVRDTRIKKRNIHIYKLGWNECHGWPCCHIQPHSTTTYHHIHLLQACRLLATLYRVRSTTKAHSQACPVVSHAFAKIKTIAHKPSTITEHVFSISANLTDPYIGLRVPIIPSILNERSPCHSAIFHPHSILLHHLINFNFASHITISSMFPSEKYLSPQTSSLPYLTNHIPCSHQCLLEPLWPLASTKASYL